MDFGRISVGSPKGRKSPSRVSALAQTEAQLVASCLQWLGLHRAAAYRQNQGQMKVADETRAKGFRRIVFAGAKGVSDIIGCLPCGCFLAAECKVKDRELTKDQRGFLEWIAGANGVALEVRDEVDSLIRMVEAHEAGCGKRERRTA